MPPRISTVSGRVLPTLGLLLLSAPAFAGEVYLFTTEFRGGLQEHSSNGTILVDGNRYRLTYDSDEPTRTHGAVVSKDGGAREFALNSKDRTFFELEKASPQTPTSSLFGLIPAWGERTVRKVKLDMSAHPALEAMAGMPVRRHDMALSYDLSIAMSPPPNSRIKAPLETIRGKVKLQASFWMAEERAPLPVRSFRPEIHTGLAAIDDRLSTALAALRGLAVKQQVSITAEGDQGVAPRSETTIKVIASVRSSKTQPALFEVPSGYRMHKPEFTRPGLESAPGFDRR